MDTNLKYKALSDATRRKILDLLKDKDLTASDIAEHCNSTKPNISQHLNVLKNAGLIQDDKQGLYVYYSLNKEIFIPINKEVKSMISIKDKILSELKVIAINKNCEAVTGATDSQDEGTIFIMKDSATILSFHYSFRLSSFLINFEIPANMEGFKIEYQDTLSIVSFYESVRDLIDTHFQLREEAEAAKDKEKSIALNAITEFLDQKTNGSILFGRKDDSLIENLRQWSNEAILTCGARLSESEKNNIINEAILEVTSLGKIHKLLEDSSVSEIMINSPSEVAVEKNGKLVITDIKFSDENEIRELARKIARICSRRLDNSLPFLDAKLPVSRSRVSIIIPPLSVKGTTITIRKFSDERLSMNDLVKFDSLSKEASEFLIAAVKSRANIVISGGLGAGKTTMLNILAQYIPNHERVVSAEDSLELDLDKEHLVKLETRTANAEGLGEITIRDLIKASLRLRPDRIIAGEVRDGAAFDFLLSYQNGHDGSMTSVLCNSVDAFEGRLINLLLHSGTEVPDSFYFELLQGIDLVVHLSRLRDGSRKVMSISEVKGYDRSKNCMIMTPLFEWQSEGIANGQIKGKMHYTGKNLSDDFHEKMERHGQNPNFSTIKDFHPSIQFEKEIESKITTSLSLLADALRAGHPLVSAFKMFRIDSDDLLSREFEKAAKEVETGKPLDDTLMDLKKRISQPEFSLFIHSLIIHVQTGGHYESMLRHLIPVIEDRLVIRSSIPLYKKLQFSSSREWELIDFIDLLSSATPNCKNFEDAMERTCSLLESNVSAEFSKALDEIKSGKRVRDALNSLAARIDTPEIKMIVSLINQSETFGTDVTKTLQSAAFKMRQLFKIMYKM